MKKFFLILLSALFAFNVSAQRTAVKVYKKDVVLKHQKTLCCDTIRGKVFLDINGNGVKDSLEYGIPNQLVTAGQSFDYANSAGDYTITVDTGYTTVRYTPQGYLTSSPDSIVVHFAGIGANSPGNNFACQVISGIRDLSVSLVATAFRPGFIAAYYIYVGNEGTQIESGKVELNYDTQLTYQYAQPAHDSTSGNSVFWNFNNLPPGSTHLCIAYVQTPQSVPLGTILLTSANVVPIAGDTVPLNNFSGLESEVVGSFDPNDKLVYPEGSGTQGYIGFGEVELDYTIRFQNTGTDTAFTVVIKDTLDADLNLATIKLLSSSHPVAFSLENSNMLKFTFCNILLPDSNVNQMGSNGFVKYAIKTKSGLIKGTQITNDAYIYFDFNQPVATNTTLNTVGVPLGIPEIETVSSASNIFPNPMNISATIKIASGNNITTANLKIYDILGNLVFSQKGINTNEILIYRGNLKQGIYFFKIANDNKIFGTGKFVVE